MSDTTEVYEVENDVVNLTNPIAEALNCVASGSGEVESIKPPADEEAVLVITSDGDEARPFKRRRCTTRVVNGLPLSNAEIEKFYEYLDCQADKKYLPRNIARMIDRCTPRFLSELISQIAGAERSLGYLSVGWKNKCLLHSEECGDVSLKLCGEIMPIEIAYMMKETTSYCLECNKPLYCLYTDSVDVTFTI